MIEIKFKCLCMREETALHVRYRNADEDLGRWMRKVVQPALSDAHREVSPDCQMTTMEYVKIPILEKDLGIGLKPKGRPA